MHAKTTISERRACQLTGLTKTVLDISEASMPINLLRHLYNVA